MRLPSHQAARPRSSSDDSARSRWRCTSAKIALWLGPQVPGWRPLALAGVASSRTGGAAPAPGWARASRAMSRSQSIDAWAWVASGPSGRRRATVRVALMGAPFGMRAMSDRPFGPSNALRSWFARSARSSAAPFGIRAMSDRPFGPSNALCLWFARSARSRRRLSPVALDRDAIGRRDTGRVSCRWWTSARTLTAGCTARTRRRGSTARRSRWCPSTPCRRRCR